jgi:hypothetical protein
MDWIKHKFSLYVDPNVCYIGLLILVYCSENIEMLKVSYKPAQNIT